MLNQLKFAFLELDMYHELTGHLLIVNVEPQTSLCGAGGGVGLVTVKVDTNHEGLDIGEHSLT